MQHDAWYVAICPWCAIAVPPIAVASLVARARTRSVIVKAQVVVASRM
jgi:hypothetical protein